MANLIATSRGDKVTVTKIVLALSISSRVSENWLLKLSELLLPHFKNTNNNNNSCSSGSSSDSSKNNSKNTLSLQSYYED